MSVEQYSFEHLFNHIYQQKQENIDKQIPLVVEELNQAAQQIHLLEHNKDVLNLETSFGQFALSHIMSNNFFNSVYETIEYFEKNLKQQNKKQIIASFLTSDYIDYLSNKLESQDEEGPFLAGHFVKQVGKISKVSKYLKFEYTLSFLPNGNIVGFLQQHNQDNITEKHTFEAIHQAYFNSIKTPLKKDLLEELSDFPVEEKEHISQILSEILVNKKLQHSKQAIKFDYPDFKNFFFYAKNVHLINKESPKNISNFRDVEKLFIFLEQNYPQLLQSKDNHHLKLK